MDRNEESERTPLEKHLRDGSRGFPVPKILAFLSVCTTVLTGSLTVRGSSFSFGRAAADSEHRHMDSCSSTRVNDIKQQQQQLLLLLVLLLVVVVFY